MDVVDIYVVPEFEKTIIRFQQQALAELLKQIIIALPGQKYEFHEILNALVKYSKCRDDWGEVTNHIQAARVAVLEASARLRGEEEGEE